VLKAGSDSSMHGFMAVNLFISDGMENPMNHLTAYDGG
jgi:hypothetical protein